MNQHIRKTKSVASHHPAPVLGDPFPFDLDKRGDGESHPYHIHRIESHAADFSAGSVGGHIAGSQHDN